ncbi:MAG: MBL fold metallo-hydrolase [Bacteroidia bacterium]
MYIKSFIFNDFQENTYVLYDDTKECVIIDPGCYQKHEKEELTDFIGSNNLKPVKLINTHCHIDHVLGNAFVAEHYNLTLYFHQDELKTYDGTARWADLFGLVLNQKPEKMQFINEGETITFGNTTLDILFTPGHSVASLTFVHHPTKNIIAGDVLFYLSIGRTDLPGGNFEILKNSITQKLFTLPADYKVYSGHGPTTNIGFEKANNPFLK